MNLKTIYLLLDIQVAAIPITLFASENSLDLSAAMAARL